MECADLDFLRAGNAGRQLSPECRAQEDAFKQQQEAQLTFSNRAGHGVAEKRPEDSVYFHPTLNPEGIPPPGKPQARAPARCMHGHVMHPIARTAGPSTLCASALGCEAADCASHGHPLDSPRRRRLLHGLLRQLQKFLYYVSLEMPRKDMGDVSPVHVFKQTCLSLAELPLHRAPAVWNARCMAST